MAKRRTTKSRTKKREVKTVLISLGIVFSIIMFVVKLIGGSIGWFEVFAPLLIAFFIVFVISILKTVLNKV